MSKDRGRPNASSVKQQKKKGLMEPSKFKCHYCGRNFPRNKSLTAHIRIHTGEKPFECTYPSCNMAFVQSGQLNLHMMTHTGEKPYKCPAEGCTARFTHPNRRCRKHDEKVIRDIEGSKICQKENLSPEEQEWIKQYIQDRRSVIRKQISSIKDGSPATASKEDGSPFKAINKGASSSKAPASSCKFDPWSGFVPNPWINKPESTQSKVQEQRKNCSSLDNPWSSFVINPRNSTESTSSKVQDQACSMVDEVPLPECSSESDSSRCSSTDSGIAVNSSDVNSSDVNSSDVNSSDVNDDSMDISDTNSQYPKHLIEGATLLYWFKYHKDY